MAGPAPRLLVCVCPGAAAARAASGSVPQPDPSDAAPSSGPRTRGSRLTVCFEIHALDPTRTVAVAVSPWTPAWPPSAEQAGPLHPPGASRTLRSSPLVALGRLPPSELVSCAYLPAPPPVGPRKSPPVHLAPLDARTSLGRQLSFSLLFESRRLLRPAPVKEERRLGVAARWSRPAWGRSPPAVSD